MLDFTLMSQNVLECRIKDINYNNQIEIIIKMHQSCNPIFLIKIGDITAQTLKRICLIDYLQVYRANDLSNKMVESYLQLYKYLLNKISKQQSFSRLTKYTVIVKQINCKDPIMSYEMQKVQDGEQGAGNSQSLELSQQFFTQMFNLQHAYQQEKSSAVLQQLMVLYTDCVTYFQVRSESATIYFQNKIKELSQQHKLLFSGEFKNQGRAVINQNILKSMEQEDIYKRVGHEMKRAQENQKVINNIIRAQQEALQNRIRKTKRLAKTLSNRSFSSTSFTQSFSPEKKTERKPLKQGYLIFTTQIHTQESDNQ